MKELKEGRISILISSDKTRIELKDNSSGLNFAYIELTPEQLSRALSREAQVECDIKLYENFERLGKTLEVDKFEFEYNKNIERHKVSDLVFYQIAKKLCPEGWEPDKYFGSKESFFKKDGKNYARAIIRRWV